jgi:hypothetical protein
MHVVPLCTPVRKPRAGQAAQTSSFLPEQLIASLGDRSNKLRLILNPARPVPCAVSETECVTRATGEKGAECH